MSEYQYVAFRAIDRAVNEKNLAYMQKQPSRATLFNRRLQVNSTFHQRTG
jgi:hypothetical protein